MTYTREGMMAQAWIAFGQGTSYMRVSQEAAMKLYDIYYKAATDEVVAAWEAESVQILERFRAIGRLSAQLATAKGETTIKTEYVVIAAITVQAASDTERCPPDTGG